MQVPRSTGRGSFLHHVTIIFCLLAFITTATRNAMADPCSQSSTSIVINAPSNSDTFVSLPVTPPPAFCGTVASASGTNLIVNGSPALGGQASYVLMTSGAKEGAIYSISSVSNSSVTVNPPLQQYCDDLTGINPGDSLAIVPYWTLNTLWPNGAGLRTGTASSSTLIDLWNVQIQRYSSYYYKSTGGVLGGIGWRSIASPVIDVSMQAVDPFATIVIRQINSSSNLTFSVTGSEIEYQSRTCLLAPASGTTGLYNFVSNNHYYSSGGQTLGSSGLAGAFAASNPSANPPQINDELLVFDNSVVANNKAPKHVYIYFSGIWGDLNNPPVTTDRSADLVFTPGTGVVIRKATGFSSPTYWINPYP